MAKLRPAGLPPVWTKLPHGAFWLQHTSYGTGDGFDRTMTLTLLGAMGSAANLGWKNVTDAVIIYTTAAANTFYQGTPASPLATHAYDAGDILEASTTGVMCVCGITGEFTPDVEVVPFGGYTATGNTTPLSFLSGKNILGLRLAAWSGATAVIKVDRASDGRLFCYEVSVDTYPIFFSSTAVGPDTWITIPSTTSLRVRTGTEQALRVVGIAICKV